MQTIIRLAEPSDAPAIAAVHIRSWRTTYPGIIAQEYLDSLSVEGRSTSWVRRFPVQGPSAPTVVLAQSPTGDVLGFAAGAPRPEGPDPLEAQLHALYVDHGSQRQGLGRRLVAAWANHILDRGCRSAVVAVLAKNPACSFYEHLGATYLETIDCEIGGGRYPERMYRWDNLLVLTG